MLNGDSLLIYYSPCNSGENVRVVGPISLTYHSLTVELRAPEFGHESQILGPLEPVASFNGSRYFGGRDAWFSETAEVYSFAYLTKVKKEELELFLIESAGDRILLTDHFGRTREGFLIPGDFSFIDNERFPEDNPGEDCYQKTGDYQFSFTWVDEAVTAFAGANGPVLKRDGGSEDTP